MKIYHGKCMVYHGVLKQVNHGKPWQTMVNTMIYHGILWDTIVYFHKGIAWNDMVYHGITLVLHGKQ